MRCPTVWQYPPQNQHSPWKRMVGRWLSFWGLAYFQGRTVSFKEVSFSIECLAKDCSGSLHLCQGLVGHWWWQLSIDQQRHWKFCWRMQQRCLACRSQLLHCKFLNRPNTTTAMLTNFFKGNLQGNSRVSTPTWNWGLGPLQEPRNRKDAFQLQVVSCGFPQPAAIAIFRPIPFWGGVGWMVNRYVRYFGNESPRHI